MTLNYLKSKFKSLLGMEEPIDIARIKLNELPSGEIKTRGIQILEVIGTINDNGDKSSLLKDIYSGCTCLRYNLEDELNESLRKIKVDSHKKNRERYKKLAKQIAEKHHIHTPKHHEQKGRGH